MSFSESDNHFLAQASSVVGEKTFTAGDIDMVNRLIEGESSLGKRFYTKFDASKTPSEIPVWIGTILPLNRSGTSHLVIFISGEMLITKPKNPKTRNQYKAAMSPDSKLDHFVKATSIKHIADSGFTNDILGSTVVARKSNPKQAQLFIGALPTALEILAKSTRPQAKTVLRG